MNIYLPMKDDLLDKGEGTVWTGNGWKEPEIVKFDGIKCAKFDGNSRLQLKDTTSIKSLKEWTMQAWLYCIGFGSYSNSSYVFTTYMLGSSWTDSYLNVSLISPSTVYLQQTAGSTHSFTNTWHHVKVTTNGSNLVLYLDNQKLIEINSYNINLASPAITIGDEAGTYKWGTGFYGYMTQFKFSDKYNDVGLPKDNSKFIYMNKNNEAWAMV